jgi:hypothetical protein
VTICLQEALDEYEEAFLSGYPIDKASLRSALWFIALVLESAKYASWEEV